METKEINQNVIMTSDENGVVVNIIGKNFNMSIEVFFRDDLIYTMSNAREEYVILKTQKYLTKKEKGEYYNDFFECIRSFLQRCADGLENVDSSTIKLGVILSIRNKLIENIDIEEEKPPYIENAINKGILYPDGCRVIESLEKIAIYLKDKEEINISEQFLLETFRKPDGKQYSSSSAKLAINLANTPASEREKLKQSRIS